MSIFNIEQERNIPLEIANGLLAAINNEAERRAGLHRDLFNALWYSKESSPAEILAAMGQNAGLFFALAAENVKQIAASAAVAGKSLDDYLKQEEYIPPVNVVVNPDGTAEVR